MGELGARGGGVQAILAGRVLNAQRTGQEGPCGPASPAPPPRVSRREAAPATRTLTRVRVHSGRGAGLWCSSPAGCRPGGPGGPGEGEAHARPGGARQRTGSWAASAPRHWGATPVAVPSGLKHTATPAALPGLPKSRLRHRSHRVPAATLQEPGCSGLHPIRPRRRAGAWGLEGTFSAVPLSRRRSWPVP